ncbi:MAG: ATP-binding protein [Candidatus Thorarchaeota archaeon]
MSTIHSEGEEIGIVVGEASTTAFWFSTTQEQCPSKFDYIQVKSREVIRGKLEEIEVLAQVESIFSSSDALKRAVSFDALSRIMMAGLEDLRVYGKARIMGYTSKATKDDVLIPRRSVAPGTKLRVASSSLLKEFYSFPADEALSVGTLMTRPEVKVALTVSGFRRHLAIIAQTGAGKSYCTGVLIEELLKMGATILILDPHADYVMLSKDKDGKAHKLSNRCKVFRNPASTGRYSKKDIGNLEEYTIAFSDLTPDEIVELAGVQSFQRIRDTFESVIANLLEEKKAFTPSDLVSKLEAKLKSASTQREKNDLQSALRYARPITRMRVFSKTSTPIDKLLAPMQATTLDLSGLDHFSLDYIVCKLLGEVYSQVLSDEFPHPVFVFIEEAHNLIPAKNSTRSSPIIRRIAGEGRKFGVFLGVVTQRPSKIHSDTLSQCNSQIIMKLTNPKDQDAVEDSSERMSKELLDDLPGLNPGEAVIVGPLTKTPVMVKIRTRETQEGGADIDVKRALKIARKEAGIDEKLHAQRKKSAPFEGTFEEE